MTPSTVASLLGTVLGGRYELVQHLARGGMGDVYEARDRVLRRSVAVKLYRATAPANRARFDAEVTMLATLNHPGLVRVYDAGEHDGDGFVVLELVDGPSLRAILAEHGARPPDEVAALGAQVAGALAYVHAQGIVHRDVSPGNILCGADGRPRLADFGIARLLDTTRITAVGTTIGTVAYMAPEQLEGREVTPVADVYALGLVLLEALTGRPGFRGTSREAAVARLVRGPDVVTDVPVEWSRVLAAMTARDPEVRLQSREVATQLERLGAVAADGARSVGDGGATAGITAVSVASATRVLDAPGGTEALPIAQRPALEHDGVPSRGGRPLARLARSAPARWVAAAAIGLVILVVAALADTGLDATSTSTTAPVAVTTTPSAAPVTTTAPPPTTQPEQVAADDDGPGKDNEGRGNSGKGNGRGKGD